MPKFVIYRDARNEFRWKCVARNGKIIADSGEGYTTLQSAKKGIRALKLGSFTAKTIIEVKNVSESHI